MAEVINNWPPQKPKRAYDNQFRYPWGQWTAVDADGIGDIWLAEQGVDWPIDATAMRFRSNLATHAKAKTAQRKKKAPLVLKVVEGYKRPRRVPDYKTLRVKVVIVSDSQVAFQFYEGDEPPAEPMAGKVAVPLKPKRQNIHAPRKIRRHVKVSA